MNTNKEIRWKQRFQNFEKVFTILQKTVELTNPSEIEVMAMIQAFEMNFEVAWKMMKDYLETEGFEPKSPRETIKYAFQAGIIQDAHCWMNALQDRNLTVHTYDEILAKEMEQKIRTNYFPAIESLYSAMSMRK